MAIIFNHERFNDSYNHPIRYGTEVDRDNLQETFEMLGFTVEVYNNRTFAEIKDELQKSKYVISNQLSFL